MRIASLVLLWCLSALAGPAEVSFYSLSPEKPAAVTSRLMGEKTSVRVTGLEAGERYRVKAAFVFDGKQYHSYLDALADAKGTIDTASAKPLEGTYSKPDPDGLFWSAVAQGAGKGRDLETTLFVEKNGQTLATATLPVAFTKPGTRVVDLADQGIVGKLFVPAVCAKKKCPAVVAYGGSEGGEMTGLLLASAASNDGFVTLGLAYFAAPGLPAALDHIPLEYFEMAITYLQARPEVNGNLGVMGPSRGGELSLLLGATFPAVKAVVAQVPSPIRWAGMRGLAFVAPWTHHGEELCYADPVGDLGVVKLADGRMAFSTLPVFEKGLLDKAATEKAMIAVEKTNGPILLVGAGDDQMWPSCKFSEIAKQRLERAKHPFADEVICYPGTGHLVTIVPGLPTTEVANVHPQLGLLFTMGGSPEANAAGQRASWTKTLSFLHAALGRR